MGLLIFAFGSSVSILFMYDKVLHRWGKCPRCTAMEIPNKVTKVDIVWLVIESQWSIG